MASQQSSKAFVFSVLALAFLVQGILGNIECENLNKHSCAFAVSSSGNRCVLEKSVGRNGYEEYTCGTSEIGADDFKNRVETDECVNACGVDRHSLGISSDSLLESRFALKLCSNQCYHSCPNIVDLYFNLAAGEGIYLPKLCEEQGANARREMVEIRSSGYVAPAPDSFGQLKGRTKAVNFYNSPAPSVAPIFSPEIIM